jgi:GIY-YIG catalytic domain
MGLTAAEILVTFIPVAGPALALGLGAVQLGMRVEELADRAMLARLATSPYSKPLGVEPVSGFEWAMLGVQAALVAASAYGVYRTYRASAQAASAAAAEREAAAAEARAFGARLNAPRTSANVSEPMAGPATQTSPGAPGTTTSTRPGAPGTTTSTHPGAAGQTSSTAAVTGSTRPPAATRQLIVARDFQAGLLNYRFAAAESVWEAFDTIPPGYAVYKVRNADGRVIYVGVTGRPNMARWREHLAEKGGEWLGQADRFEFVAVGLDTEKLALALEDDLMRELKPQFNRQWTFMKKFRRPPQGVEIPQTNTSIVLKLTHR